MDKMEVEKVELSNTPFQLFNSNVEIKSEQLDVKSIANSDSTRVKATSISFPIPDNSLALESSNMSFLKSKRKAKDQEEDNVLNLLDLMSLSRKEKENIVIDLSEEEGTQVKPDESQGLKRKKRQYKNLFPTDKTYNWQKFNFHNQTTTKQTHEKEFKALFADNPDKKFKMNELISEKKNRRLQQIELSNSYVTSWNSDLKSVVLDGDDLILNEDSIRKISINKENQAQKALYGLAENFLITTNLEAMNIIFYNLKNIVSQSKIRQSSEKSLGISMFSALANKCSVEEVFMDIMRNQDTFLTENIVYVTSNKNLGVLLKQNGAKFIMKSETWLQVVKEYIGENLYNGIITEFS